jgi:GAF domain-containing protein
LTPGLGCAPGNAEALLARGVHTFMAVPLIARGVTLGVAGFARAAHPGSYGEADVRLVSDLAFRAAVHVDNARLYTREHDAAVTVQRSLSLGPSARDDIALLLARATAEPASYRA